MKIMRTTRFLQLLLILSPLMKAMLAAPPMVDEHRQADLLPLQRRDVICNPNVNPNLNLQDCHAALERIPGGHGIGLPLGGLDPTSPYYLPRAFVHNGCRITIQLEPGLNHVILSWATVRYRAGLLVNLCVGGLGAWAPGYNNHGLVPGRGGNDTYGGVQIGVHRV